jgi:hypothetical protein
MRKITYLCAALFLGSSLSFATTVKAGTKTFVGNVSDSMCGLKHMMPGKSDKECTLECVKAGSKFVLADLANGKVYQLSDQKKPEPLAGQKVKITGSLRGDTISVITIEPAP